jgi:hypothetical protein
MWYLNLEETFISRHILRQHWYTCPITLPVHWNLQQGSLLTVVSANSAPHFHYLWLSNVLERISRTSCEPLYMTNTSNHKQEAFFLWISFPLSPSAHKKCTTERCSLVVHAPQTRLPFWLLKWASEHAHACLLPIMSWSWTVLLHSDTHRETIIYITAVLLPFVTCLLTLPYTSPRW